MEHSHARVCQKIKDQRLLACITQDCEQGDLYALYEYTVIFICNTAYFQIYFSLFVQACPQNSALSLSSCIEMTEVRLLITEEDF